MKKFISFVLAVLLLSSCSSIAGRDHSLEYGRAPLLSFVFDDGNDTDYLVAREIFKKEGAAASFAVVTGWVNTRDHLTVSQLLALRADGFEIMSHTVSHPNLRSLSAGQIEYELSVSKETLEGWGLKVNNLVYPYNMSNGLVRSLAGKYYRSARGGGSMLNPALPDRYDLKSYSFSHNTDKMKRLIDRAAAERKWLIIYLHNMDIKVIASGGHGSFRPGEGLLFSPSGATGRYNTELFNWLYFVPFSGTPREGDTITGQSSGATCRLDEVVYNEKKALTGLIEYARSRHPGMRIVTTDEGLDIYKMK
jgi:peptidoglycan/xylan/chitin deacetylase (PgdA/CDA1 family)